MTHSILLCGFWSMIFLAVFAQSGHSPGFPLYLDYLNEKKQMNSTKIGILPPANDPRFQLFPNYQIYRLMQYYMLYYEKYFEPKFDSLRERNNAYKNAYLQVTECLRHANRRKLRRKYRDEKRQRLYEQRLRRDYMIKCHRHHHRRHRRHHRHHHHNHGNKHHHRRHHHPHNYLGLGRKVCANLQRPNQTGIFFKCPRVFEPAKHSVCCGKLNAEFCCMPEHWKYLNRPLIFQRMHRSRPQGPRNAAIALGICLFIAFIIFAFLMRKKTQMRVVSANNMKPTSGASSVATVTSIQASNVSTTTSVESAKKDEAIAAKQEIDALPPNYDELSLRGTEKPLNYA